LHLPESKPFYLQIKKMKKLSLILFAGILALYSCEKDEIEKDETENKVSTVNYDSRLRFESGNVSEAYNGYSTFTETKLDFDGEEVNEFSINFTDDIELTKSTILVGVNMYSDNRVFSKLKTDSTYYLENSWIAGGNKDAFSVGVTVWDENHENGVIYGEVIGGSVLFTNIGLSIFRAYLSFEMTSPYNNDTLKTKTSLILAYPN